MSTPEHNAVLEVVADRIALVMNAEEVRKRQVAGCIALLAAVKAAGEEDTQDDNDDSFDGILA